MKDICFRVQGSIQGGRCKATSRVSMKKSLSRGRPRGPWRGSGGRRMRRDLLSAFGIQFRLLRCSDSILRNSVLFLGVFNV